MVISQSWIAGGPISFNQFFFLQWLEEAHRANPLASFAGLLLEKSYLNLCIEKSEKNEIWEEASYKQLILLHS